MTVISHIDDINAEQWEQLIAESATASWFQTREAYDFYASLTEIFEPFIVAIERSGGAEEEDAGNILVGLCMGYTTREHNPIRQFFTRRAIIYGGPLLANDATEEEVECLMHHVRHLIDRKTIYIETRNFNDYSQWTGAFQNAGFTYTPHYDVHIACDTIDNMYARMQEGKRRQINKAQQEGELVKVLKGDGLSKDVHHFYQLLQQLYKKKVHTPLYPEDFFQTFIRDERGVLILTKKNGKITGGMLCPILGNRVIYEWFVVGDVIATWSTMEYAQRHGIATLDLMGAGEPGKPYGVRDFKLAMGGDLKEYGRYQYVCKPFLHTLGKLGLKIIKMI